MLLFYVTPVSSRQAILIHLPQCLIEDILYYWKVIATDDDGGETTSATWSFWTNSTNSAPAHLNLVSPEEGR